MRVLSVNTGSTSVKLSVYAAEGTLPRPLVRVKYGTEGEKPARELLARLMDEHGAVDAVVHRVVHGGRELVRPARVDAAVRQQIDALSALAPLHNPQASHWLTACTEYFGQDMAQVAVFDTGFFAHLPPRAATYALPASLSQRLGLRRYGFHGIAHQAMWQQWCELHPHLASGGRLITLQLGGGCSMAAIAAGQPQDTSMGFSPTEGLIMASRSGDVDPGLLTYLMRQEGLSADALDRLLNQDSGLKGLAGGDGDMEKLLASRRGESRLAVSAYCYRAAKYIGAYLTVLGGADGIVFGGGVGVHAPEIRRRILARLTWLGLKLDQQANDAARGGTARLTTDDSAIEAWTIDVDEGPLLAKAALEVLKASP